MSPLSPRWGSRPEGSNWGDFGPDEQLGRLNLRTPEKVHQGVAEVREGRSFALSLPFDYPGGTDELPDDRAILHLPYSTQWDGLAHVGSMFDGRWPEGCAHATVFC